MLASLTLLLAGCVREVALTVVRAGDLVTIAATRPGTGKTPCIEGLSITPAGTDIATTPPLWEIATAEPGRCRATFAYGQVPPGFAQGGIAPALLVGRRYVLQVSGPGLLGAQDFTMRAGSGSMADAARH